MNKLMEASPQSLGALWREMCSYYRDEAGGKTGVFLSTGEWENNSSQAIENRKITGVSVWSKRSLFPADIGRAEKGKYFASSQELVDVAQGAEMTEGASK